MGPSLIERASAAGVTLEVRLWCSDPARLPAELRDELAEHRPAVIAALLGSIAPAIVEPEPAAVEPVRPEPVLAPIGRNTSWTDAGDLPAPGTYCSCCTGRRWWAEAVAPKGWRCRTCHPPDHLAPAAVRVVRT